MTAVVFIFLIVLMFSLYQLGAILLSVRETRRLREIRNRTETQLEFGKLRHKLMLLAAEGELRTDSITFLSFYTTHTLVMRNPDRYRRVAAFLRESFYRDFHDTESRSVIEHLNEESNGWNVNVKSMVIQTGDAVTNLVIRHSPFIRWLYTIAQVLRHFVTYVIRRELGLIAGGMRVAAKVNSTNRTFLDTKDDMLRLAS